MTEEPPAKSAKRKPGVISLELPERALKQMSTKFPEGVTVLVCPPEHLQPEFIRLPKAGEICPVTGLPRTTLIELLQRAGKAVPVRHIRQPGATTGIALIPRQKLVDYIHGLPVPEWQEDESNENAD